MSTPLAILIDRARQGDARAIAHLIARSLAADGVVARGQWRGEQLYLELESSTALDRDRLVPQIQRGLLRLGLTCPLNTVQLTARRTGLAEADWRTSFGLDAPLATPAARTEAEPDPAPPAPGGGTTAPSPVPAMASSNGLPVDGLPPIDQPTASSSHAPDATLSDTTLVALVHLAPLLSYLVLGSQWLGGWPLLWGGSFLLPWRVVAPLALLLAKGTGAAAATHPTFSQRQAKAALNFQLTMFIAWVITIALMVVLVGFLLVVPLALFEIVSCIVAAVTASEGKPVRYLAIRFVR
ncbi:DUF4870 domain-containing protein [Leptolyngbya sp. KIOST-1]|uniref:DUF4870 domain-containing protein n=1 Tax=Leptolyngbya sp. KIOST-1 TaxID=1229172 RepID=UPI00068C563F|nr:DUF4870 domain-containing protein [Leptolyngbya sp. KIOST-1]